MTYNSIYLIPTLFVILNSNGAKALVIILFADKSKKSIGADIPILFFKCSIASDSSKKSLPTDFNKDMICLASKSVRFCSVENKSLISFLTFILTEMSPSSSIDCKNLVRNINLSSEKLVRANPKMS